MSIASSFFFKKKENITGLALSYRIISIPDATKVKFLKFANAVIGLGVVGPIQVSPFPDEKKESKNLPTNNKSNFSP